MSPYYWCDYAHYDTIMHKLPNELTKFTCSTTVEVLRHSETSC